MDEFINVGQGDLFFGEDGQPQDLQPQQPVGEGTVDAEGDAVHELNEVLQGFKDRSDRENQRLEDATDSEYWVAICFQTRDQKEEFLRKLKLLDLGDKYLDGMKVARKLGVKLESRIPEMPRERPYDQEYVRMAKDLDQDPTTGFFQLGQ